MSTKRWMVLLVGVIALGMVAHVLIAADEEGPRKGRPAAERGRRGGERARDGQRPGAEGAARGGAERRGPGAGRPMAFRSPLMVVLDVNKDGALSAREIANAAKALLKLDEDGDGALSREELRPPRPEGRTRPGAGEGAGERRGPGAGERRGPGAGERRGPGAGERNRERGDKTRPEPE